MTLEIIGAGFGRTGTESMKKALELIGFGPCYHMYEVTPHAERFDHWRAVYEHDADPNWDETFKDYRATVDWPAARYWRELADHYPKAKVLLTVRDAESWYASMEKTIIPLIRDPSLRRSLAPEIGKAVFGGNVDDKAHVIAVYQRNIDRVQALTPPERLLTYELGSGWGPLCDFLGVAVPSTPFPRGNDAKAFQNRA